MTYGLVMIAKDEAAGILGTLETLRPFISYWIVCDTGSTDGTQDLIREYLKDIPGKLYQDKWVNFGHNRSLALARAYKARERVDWWLASDADMHWTIDPTFTPPQVESLSLKMGAGSGFEWRLPLVLRADIEWKSVGAVHEYTTRMDGQKHVSLATDKLSVMYQDRSDPAKTAWQLGMLREEMEKDPDNSRTVFYAAQCSRELGAYADARALYARRAQMGGYEQERWYAMYWAAQLEETPDARLLALIACWEARPARLEPLCLAAREMNARGWHHAAYALLNRPIQPTDDVFFVHTTVWEWGIDFEKHIAAWWVGKRKESADLGRKLLKRKDLPDHIRLAIEANLKYT
jgi:hypothetical protein